jgi:hypothetical protein
MNVKASENPASIPYFPAETNFCSKFFHNTDVVRNFSQQWKWKTQNFDFCGFEFVSLIFRNEILYAKYVDSLDKLKEVKKSLLF